MRAWLRGLLARRRERREYLAWKRWYASLPCPPSYAEPWLSAGERKHSKGGV